MQNLKLRDGIQRFIMTLPQPVSVKAYGSSVAFQSGYTECEKRQVDLIVIVDDIKRFYQDNLVKNAGMYKLVPKLFFNYAPSSVLRSAAHICYTSHIKSDDDIYKMGVIEKCDLLDDLLNWNTFYMAGRFQKEMFTALSDKEIESANEINKKNALTVALLLLDKDNPTIDDLYEKICSLSYMGDSRKIVGAEDPNKVKKIASGSRDFFDREYTQKTDLYTVLEDGRLEVDNAKLYGAIFSLPKELGEKVIEVIDESKSFEDNLAVIRDVISEHLTSLTNEFSIGQTVKGIFTNGPINSCSYVLEKLKKGRKKI